MHWVQESADTWRSTKQTHRYIGVKHRPPPAVALVPQPNRVIISVFRLGTRATHAVDPVYPPYAQVDGINLI